MHAPTHARLRFLLLAALAALALSACDDDGGANEDDTASGDTTAGDTATPDTTSEDTATGDTATGDTAPGDTATGDTTTSDTGADTEPDVAPVPDSITASDQTLDDLSTVVTIDQAALGVAGWVVLHEDDATSPGAPGRILGFAPLAPGNATALEVAVDRPIFDGETLHAMLHVDQPADGEFTFDGQNGEDMPALAPDDGLLMDTFVATVPDGTPAVRFTVLGMGTRAYRWSAEPALYEAWIGDEPDNQTLYPQWSWRYEIVNQSTSFHPLELITRGLTRDTDVVLLSQDATGALEADPEVAWVEDGNAVRFTMAGALPSALDGYRCAVPEHPEMRGIIDAPSP